MARETHAVPPHTDDAANVGVTVPDPISNSTISGHAPAPVHNAVIVKDVNDPVPTDIFSVAAP